MENYCVCTSFICMVDSPYQLIVGYIPDNNIVFQLPLEKGGPRHTIN